MKKQLETLLKAENEVNKQISDWENKRNLQIETMINLNEKIRIQEISNKIQKITENEKSLKKELEIMRGEYKEIEETYKKSYNDILVKIESEKSKIETIIKSQEKSRIENETELENIKKMLESYNLQHEELLMKFKKINLQLEDAKLSYKSAKDAEISSKKLHSVRNLNESMDLSNIQENHNRSMSLDISKISNKNEDINISLISKQEDECAVEIENQENLENTEIVFPEMVCLPLQQCAAEKISKKLNQGAEKSSVSITKSNSSISNTLEISQESKEISLEKNIEVPSGRTRCSSRSINRIGNNIKPIVLIPKQINEKPAKENVEKCKKYQKYINPNSKPITKNSPLTHSITNRILAEQEEPKKEFDFSNSVQEPSKNWANQLWCPSVGMKISERNEKNQEKSKEFSFSLMVPDISNSNLSSLMQNASFIDQSELLKNEVGSNERLKMMKNNAVLAQLVQIMIKGNNFYKKFSTKFSAKLPSFDPIKAKICPPTHCGYSLRQFNLSKDYTNIIISNPNISENEGIIIPIKSIVKPIVPQQTLEIIKAQKYAKENMVSKIASILTNQKNANGESLCGVEKIKEFEECKYFPFMLELAEKGKLELIATEYKDLKVWVIGIGLLTKNKKLDDMLPTKEN